MDAYLKIMTVLEKNSDCSGACTPALFWFSKSIDTQPKDACTKALGDELAGDYKIPGFVTIFASIIMLLIFCFQYTLWCDKGDSEQ